MGQYTADIGEIQHGYHPVTNAEERVHQVCALQQVSSEQDNMYPEPRLIFSSFGTVIHRDVVSSVFAFFFPGEQFLAIWG